MNESSLSQLYLKDTAFQNLMQERIYNVLLIASTYDAFMMEEDGRVEEQIYFEYVSLNLSSPPRVMRATNYDEAMLMLEKQKFDLIIAMPGVNISETFTRAQKIKQLYDDVNFVVLTPFSREVSRRIKNEDFSSVDYVFSWLGNVDLLVAIIKLLEDKMNAHNDVKEVGVQMILLVEDSVRFYSSVLPTIYRFILRQSQRFSTEALNAHERMMRMRGRPKVMLARDYEEAVEIYNEYKDQMMGIISDVSFTREGKKDRQAGLKLAKYLRSQDPYLPIIVESSDSENREMMGDFGGVFLDKNSKKLPVDLGEAIMNNFGFGEFVIRDPKTGSEIMRIADLQDLQKRINDIPDDSLIYHGEHNDFSRWLYSRALFPIAQVLKERRFSRISDAPAMRQLCLDMIAKYRKMKNRGVVAEFHKGRFDRFSNFARIGQGSLGGKGRGLAFIDNIIKQNPICDDYDGVVVKIPHSVVLCTDLFDEFMESNNLYKLALSDASDEIILKAFLEARLPQRLYEDLMAIYDVFDGPLAIRSSSLLEDSHYQPFAGVYATYMVPRLDDRKRMLKLITDAVKAVYASVFYAESKSYMVATRNVIDQEKMAVIIQEVVGKQRGQYFYPSFSGVGRSINYYPINNELASDGVVELAVGLGSYIVGGGMALRVSPKHPRKVLQTSSLNLALRDTQTYLNALDSQVVGNSLTINEDWDIAQIPVQQEAEKGNLTYMVSTYDAPNARIVDNDVQPGRKLVTFANVLKHNVFPLADIANFMLTTGEQQMGRPVEVEFAGNIAIDKNGSSKGELYWLQIRPMIDRQEMVDSQMIHANPGNVLMASHNALGHGIRNNVKYMVWVKPEKFNLENNPQIATEIEKINCTFTDWQENYILAGVGRWGSSDHALGVPVKWASISNALLVVELSMPGRRIEPSQGTHFFQNLTSMGVGYFTIGEAGDGSLIDTSFINEQPAVIDNEFVKVIKFDEPLTIAIDGMAGDGVVLKHYNTSHQENFINVELD